MKIRILILLSTFLLLLATNACKEQAKQALTDHVKHNIALLPEDAGLYAYVNFKRLQEAPFAQPIVDSVKAKVMNHEAFSDFVDQTGLNPTKDIHEIFLAAVPVEKEARPQGIMVALGNFNVSRILNFIHSKDKKKVLKKETYQKQELFYSEGKSFTFCFPDDSTLVAGERTRVKTWLDNNLKPASKLAKQQILLQNLQKMKYTRGMWVSVNPKLWQKKLNEQTAKPLQVLKNLNQFGFALDFNQDFRLFARGIFSDTEKAKLFTDAIKGVVAAGKLSVSDNREIIDILNKVEIKTEGKQIVVDFKLSREEAQKLMKEKKKLRKKMFKTV